MTRSKKLSVVLIPLAIIVSMTALSQEIEQEPLVAPINQEISSHDVAVILENIFLYPNERSLYGPGKENYGMPVREEYGKGPVVVINIKKKPDWSGKLSSGGINPWLHVQLYSDGKPLSPGTGSSTGIFGFSFWVPGPDNVNSVELTKLGNVECMIRLSTVVKVCDIPANDVSRGSQPFFEDDNVQVWDVKWQERSGYDNETETSVKIGIETKTKFVTLDAVFKSKDEGQDIKPTSASFIPASDSLEKATLYFSRYVTRNRLNGAELWKIVPVVEKTFPVRFVPQKDVFGKTLMAADFNREICQK
jgi:hypothetical protein